MIVTFRIHYQTKDGQYLAVIGEAPSLGDNDLHRVLRLNPEPGGYWSAHAELKDGKSTYHYLLIDAKGVLIEREDGPPRRLPDTTPAGAPVLLHDQWRIPAHPENALYTSAFFEVLMRSRAAYKSPGVSKKKTELTIVFQMRTPQSPEGWRLCVSGNIDELGAWDPAKPLLLGNEKHPVWTGACALRSGLEVAYKYAWYDPEKGAIARWENGPNRRLLARWLAEGHRHVVLSDEYFNAEAWRGAGMAIPVFSLRSKRGLGVGEFNDLKLAVDWARAAGLKMVQILPVNDTCATHVWVDSYPYAAISVFALHPLYLHVDALGELPGPEQKLLAEERSRLNQFSEVDYEAVMNLKLRLARKMFEQDREDFLADEDFQRFFNENAHWLKPYAAFCYLRDKHGTVDFKQWKGYAVFLPAKLAKLVDPKARHYPRLAFWYYLQYHLDQQLSDAARHARENGVILKGDIPIGIYRHSVDAWVAPRLYNMNGQAGAPPDPFSAAGQNWGFPTYNWEEMAKDDYQWWRLRLQQLSRYFDAFRIDHILGFFRIWEIPHEHIEGIMGRFRPALPVSIEEFRQRGIAFDRERFCRPYITETLLYDLFGADAALVRERFLEQEKPYVYRFKDEFDTQRKLDAFLSRPENATLAAWRSALYALIANVLFFEEAESEGQAFHPRFDLHKTWSFQALDTATRKRIDDLYIDYFYRRQENFWRQESLRKLPAIKSATNMLICGEDLGLVPACVPGVMRRLGILSLEIQRMSKNPKTEFLQAADIPYLSVCSPSTHDMSPIRAWWEETERPVLRRFYQQELGYAGGEPFYCEPWVAEAIIRMHLYWPSMWAVFPIQDILAIDGRLRRENPFEERINEPSNPRHYWRYRFHLNFEDLLLEQSFNQRLRGLLAETGRRG
jgi:4-alpha-glucanotransferase